MKWVPRAALAASPIQENHVEFYRSSIRQGKKVVLIAHSQGNFFGNISFDALTSEEKASFGIVSAANPDSFVASGGPYTTLSEDLVILAISAAKAALGQPGPLSPNFTNQFMSTDELGHSFLGAYMDVAGSRSKIVGDILVTLDGLVQPGEDISDGIITVSISSTDSIDPYFYQPPLSPGGEEVVTSVGANVSVPCDELREGVYAYQLVLLNLRPPVNSVTEAGDKTITATIEFGEGSIFPPGFIEGPSIDIKATGNQEDGFSFEILSVPTPLN